MKLFYKDYKYSKDKLGHYIKKYEVLHILGIKFSRRIPCILGNGNKICVTKGSEKIVFSIEDILRLKDTVNIIVRGNYNEITLPYEFINYPRKALDITIDGDNHKVTIGSNPGEYFNLSIYLWPNSKNCILEIGEKCSFSDYNTISIAGNGTVVKIGKNCMTALNVEMHTTDYHNIYDKNSLQIINPPANIVIGENVWLAKRATLLKGTTIPDGCIVGMNSLVNKQFTEQNCIIAGVPAKVVKHNVRWER